MNTISVEELADRLALRDVTAHYMRAMRTKDFDAMDAVFTADAVVDYTAIGGKKAPWSETKPWLRGMVENVRHFLLYVGDMYVTFGEDRGSAEVETTWHGLFAADESAEPLVIFGTYLDRFVRTRNGWRIAERTDRPTIQVPVRPPP